MLRMTAARDERLPIVELDELTPSEKAQLLAEIKRLRLAAGGPHAHESESILEIILRLQKIIGEG